MSMRSRLTFRKNSPFACWPSLCVCFGSFDCWVLGMLSQRFRKKFLWQLRQAFRHGALRFTGELRSLASPAAFEAMCEKAAKIEWVVHVKPPFGGSQRVLRYLARYTHRVAISNHRLRALENGRVSFEWKDYAHHSQRKIMTLDAVEVMRRFLLHVLPPGLVRIRQFGFLANRFRTRNLQLCRDLFAVCQTPAPADSHNLLIPTLQIARLVPSASSGG